MKKNTNKAVLKKFDSLCKQYEEIYKKNIETIKAATPEEVYVSLDVLCDVGKIDFQAINTKSNAWQYIRECENLFASKSLNYDWLNINDQMWSLEEKYPELDLCHKFDWVETSMRDDELCAYADIFLDLTPSYVCNVLMVNSKLRAEKFINLLRLSFGKIVPIAYEENTRAIIHGNNLKYRHFKESCTQYYIDRLLP